MTDKMAAFSEIGLAAQKRGESFIMRILGISILLFVMFSLPGLAMDQKWITDLNRRFPGIGHEFREAVQQKIAQYGGSLSVEALLEKLLSSPDYRADEIINAKTFGLHSELLLLYPAVGNYQEALREAKLLRDFVLKYSPDDLKVVQTFRGVYTELLIVNEQYEQAQDEVERLLAINPDDQGNSLSRGVISVRLGQLGQALEELKKLIKKPGAEVYAQQLFVFIMANRDIFQEAQVQENTMLDVMLKTLDPPEPPPKIRIPANLDGDEKPVEIVQKVDDPIAKLIALDEKGITQALGSPILESEGDVTFDRDYHYHNHTLTIRFDKSSGNVVSLQMFFLPPVDEAAALSRIGVIQRDTPPSISTNMLKVWSPYGRFSKVRLSVNEGEVIAIIVEP